MTELTAGVRFAGYRIEQLAGRGGMGVVYRATDLSLDRTVALKFISPELSRSAAFRRRFQAESRTAASLDHPNVVPIFQAGEHQGVLFLAMRFVDSPDLSEVVADHGPLAPPRAAQMAAQVGSALDAAHGAGLVHRDVKPANILLTASDHAYLTDFGLSKRLLAELGETETGTGHLLGTLDYVAPEQIKGRPVGPQTDVYALGCVLFYSLTGRAPFPLTEPEAKLWAHLSSPPPSVSGHAPAAFDPIIATAMAKEPTERFESAGELAAAATVVAAGQQGAPTRPRTVSAPTRSAPPGRASTASLRNALLSPFCLAVLALPLAVGLIFSRAAIALPVALAVYAVAVAIAYREGP